MKPKHQKHRKLLRNLELQHEHKPTKTITKNEGPLLCVDYGTKKTGIAYSTDGQIVFPLEVIPTTELQLRLPEVISQKNIKKIIWGRPQNDDGELSTLGKSIEAEAKKYSTFAAFDFIRERKSTQIAIPQTAAGEHPDALAAAVMLEWYLERKI